MTESLVSLAGLARALNLQPSALSNWRRRGAGPNRPALPDPLFIVNGAPVWTVAVVDQFVQEYRAARIAHAEAKVAEYERKLSDAMERLEREKGGTS